ncbi:MAG: DUF4124 domain-containing protein [Burkholderiales bacterium]
MNSVYASVKFTPGLSAMSALPRCAVHVLILAAGASSSPVMAQQLNKYVLPDGSVVYSDQPVPGATRAKAIESPPVPTAEQRAAAQRRAEEDRRKREEFLQRTETRRKDLDAAEQRVARARKGVADAEAALESGRTPQAGEMVGNAGGNVRPGDAYLKRIAELEQNIEKARKELDDSLKAWNSVR